MLQEQGEESQVMRRVAVVPFFGFALFAFGIAAQTGLDGGGEDVGAGVISGIEAAMRRASVDAEAEEFAEAHGEEAAGLGCLEMVVQMAQVFAQPTVQVAAQEGVLGEVAQVAAGGGGVPQAEAGPVAIAALGAARASARAAARGSCASRGFGCRAGWVPTIPNPH